MCTSMILMDQFERGWHWYTSLSTRLDQSAITGSGLFTATTWSTVSTDALTPSMNIWHDWSGGHKAADIITATTSSLLHKSASYLHHTTARLCCFDKIFMALSPTRLTRRVVLVCNGWEDWIDYADTNCWHYRSLWHRIKRHFGICATHHIDQWFTLHRLADRHVRVNLSSRWYKT